MKQIDANIIPLVEAMNAIGWIETTSSCEGHPGSKYFPDPYVAFYCKAQRVPNLCSILDMVAQECNVRLDCSLVFNSEVHGCQEDAPRGWIAFNLSMPANGKEAVLARLAELFNKGYCP